MDTCKLNKLQLYSVTEQCSKFLFSANFCCVVAQKNKGCCKNRLKRFCNRRKRARRYIPFSDCNRLALKELDVINSIQTMLRAITSTLFRRAGPLQTTQRWATRIQQQRTMFIQTQPTPNAQALMFMPGREVMPGGRGTADFPSIRVAGDSPLARKLLVINGVRSVFFGGDFVTVTKDDAIDWVVLRPEIFEVIMDFFTQGSEAVILSGSEHQPNEDTIIREDDDEVVAMIKELLETRMKPAVAEDGGSILYRGFDPETGVVKLELQGACSTCSSSSITLKNGVENMLSHYIPEVKSVEEVIGEGGDAVARANQKALSNMEKRLQESGVLRP